MCTFSERPFITSLAISKKAFSTLMLFLALVSKNLMPNSSARAWPRAVSTTFLSIMSHLFPIRICRANARHMPWLSAADNQVGSKMLFAHLKSFTAQVRFGQASKGDGNRRRICALMGCVIRGAEDVGLLGRRG